MTSQPILHPALFKFLDAIHEENTRPYFASIRPLYDDILYNFTQFVQAYIDRLATKDSSLTGVEAKKCLFRIYRDARRLAPWDPLYKYNRWAYLTPTGKNSDLAGYYLHLQPGGSFLWWWLYRPSGGDLHKIRSYLSDHGDEYLKIISRPGFKKTFGTIQGKQSSKLPRWHTDSPYPELMKYQQFLITHRYTDEEVLAPGFLDQVVADSKVAIPWLQILNHALQGE